MKLSLDLEMNQLEYKTLQDLNQISSDGNDFPQLYGGGEFIMCDKVSGSIGPISNTSKKKLSSKEVAVFKKHSYIVMQKLGTPLQTVFDAHGKFNL